MEMVHGMVPIQKSKYTGLCGECTGSCCLFWWCSKIVSIAVRHLRGAIEFFAAMESENAAKTFECACVHINKNIRVIHPDSSQVKLKRGSKSQVIVD